MNKNNKKQPFEKEIDGRRMRYCRIYNIWVNREVHMFIGNIKTQLGTMPYKSIPVRTEVNTWTRKAMERYLLMKL